MMESHRVQISFFAFLPDSFNKSRSGYVSLLIGFSSTSKLMVAEKRLLEMKNVFCWFFVAEPKQRQLCVTDMSGRGGFRPPPRGFNAFSSKDEDTAPTQPKRRKFEDDFFDEDDDEQVRVKITTNHVIRRRVMNRPFGVFCARCDVHQCKKSVPNFSQLWY
jgi:hypothetical protein